MATTTGNRASLRDLEGADEFTHRHIGPDAGDTERMLHVVGAASLDALIAETVPDSIRLDAPLALPGAVTERDTLRRDGNAYAARLREAGVEVWHDVTPRTDHYFLTEDPVRARTTMARVADEVAAALA